MSMACLELQTPGSEQRDLSAGLQQPKFQPHSRSYRSEQDPELKLQKLLKSEINHLSHSGND